MPLFIPVLIGAGLLLTGSGGIAAGGSAAKTVRGAKKRKHDSERLMDAAVRNYREELSVTLDALVAFGEVKQSAVQGPIARLRDYIAASGRAVTAQELDALDEIQESIPNVDDPEVQANVADWLTQLGLGVMAGIGVRAGVFALVAAFGTASTGTAISGLSGVAASNATMAAIGGGALAAGGGGVALGGIVMGGLLVAPVLLAVGLGAKRAAEKYDTDITAYSAQVEVAVAQLGEYTNEQPLVRWRISELEYATEGLAEALATRMDVLESMDLDDSGTHEQFAAAMILAQTLVKVLQTPVFGTDGHPNPDARTATDRATEVVAAAQNYYDV